MKYRKGHQTRIVSYRIDTSHKITTLFMYAFQIVYSPSGLIDIFNKIQNTTHQNATFKIPSKKKTKRNPEIEFDLFVSRLNDDKEKTTQLDLFSCFCNIFLC